MPTPTGLPSKGDRFQHKESGVIFIIVKREGSGAVYSVIARREDGKPAQASGNHVFGYPKDHVRFPEFAWWLQRGLFILKMDVTT